jgi:predicted enzyme related to lactoylglutathione lyase
MRKFILLIPVLLWLPVSAETVSITDQHSELKYPGKFVWSDLLTTDPGKAAGFYKDVFGWQSSRVDEDYLILSNNGRRIAGIARNQAQLDGNESNQWISFISTSDVKESHKHIVKSGAQVVAGPIKVEGRGEIGIYVAPDAAVFGIINSSSGDPEELGAGINDWIWIELWSTDTRAAAEFYEFLGYSVEDNWMSEDEDDLLLADGEIARAGLVQGHESQTKSIWLPYIRVASLEETIALTNKQGGKYHVLEGEAHNTGKIALVSDPTGGLVAIFEAAEDEGAEDDQ